jgi:hypothetical protein
MNLFAFVGVFLKLSVGSAYYFITKMITSTCTFAKDYDENVKQIPIPRSSCRDGKTAFEKPIFLSTIVFSSMCLALVWFAVFRRRHLDPKTFNRRMILLMFFPSILECIAFCIGIYAQILMALSLAMIMKGAKVVFTCLFTVTFLKRKQLAFHYFSVGLCMAGLAVAGWSEFLNNPDTGLTVFIGCILLLTSECMKAFHVILDEMMLKTNKCDILFVVGMEGLYSLLFLFPTLLLAWLAIPGSQNGYLEDLSDTVYRVESSTILKALLAVLPAVVVVLAIAGAMIIKYLTGVHNALISVSRSIVAWALELIFYYCAPSEFANMYGKQWGSYSILRLVGFLLVIVATLMYDEDIRIPWLFSYPVAGEIKPPHDKIIDIKEDVIPDGIEQRLNSGSDAQK